jgi:prepilin-type processing-associated H-X9-DG protein
VRPGLLPIVDPSAVGWGKTLHGGGGNIALVDGSVHQTTSRQFGRILEIGVTNRLIIP